MATAKKKNAPPKKSTTWTPTSAAVLRAYREQTGDELLAELERQIPPAFTPEELFKLPADAIARKEIFRKGAQYMIERLMALSRETPVIDDASSGGYNND